MPYHRKSTKERKDIYERLNERILTALAKGVKPWAQPWSAGNADGRIIIPKKRGLYT